MEEHTSMTPQEQIAASIRMGITRVFDGSLQAIEPLLPYDQYRKVRSRILGIGNDEIRRLVKSLEDYDIRPATRVEVVFGNDGENQQGE